MTREQFLNGFREQFEDTDESLISFETNFKELEEWSSMMALIIIAYIDENYAKSISGDDFKNSNTIEDLYQLVTK